MRICKQKTGNIKYRNINLCKALKGVEEESVSELKGPDGKISQETLGMNEETMTSENSHIGGQKQHCKKLNSSSHKNEQEDIVDKY